MVNTMSFLVVAMMNKNKLLLIVLVISILCYEPSLACTNRTPASKYRVSFKLNQTSLCFDNDCKILGYSGVFGGLYNFTRIGRSGANSYVYDIINNFPSGGAVITSDFNRTGRSGANSYVYDIINNFTSDTSVATTNCRNFSISFLGTVRFSENGNEENRAILYELKGFIKENKEIFGTYTGTFKTISGGRNLSLVESGTFKSKGKSWRRP